MNISSGRFFFTLRQAVVASAIVGAGFSYSSIYAFHVIACVWLAIATFLVVTEHRTPLRKPSLLYALGFFVVYTQLSLFWHPDSMVWARYQFYVLCGIIAIMAVYQSIEDVGTLRRIYSIIAAFALIALAIGLLESAGWIRWPTSRYSNYADFFGYVGGEPGMPTSGATNFFMNKPTGFSYNENTFGFMVVLSVPFFLFYKILLVRIGGLILVSWLLILIGSKALFVGLMAALLVMPFFMKNGIARSFAISGILLAVGLILVLPELVEFKSHEVRRMYSVFEQLQRGLELMRSGEFESVDSTSIRAQIYSFGIAELMRTYWLGLGFGGVEARLIENGFAIQTFHFFVLQLLIDLGVFVFGFLVSLYALLILRLRRIAKHSQEQMIGYLARATGVALIAVFPASIAPSAIHYNLTFYVLIGLALGVVKVARAACSQSLQSRRCFEEY